MLAVALVFAALAGTLLAVQRIAQRRVAAATPTTGAVIAAIEDLLPQTQCGQCGYLGCRPYAEAIANGAAINRCPPGGDRAVLALATLLRTEPLPLDTGTPPARRVARIREDECIGCTKCIQACPVDAIVGAAKLMHTVIVAECTGCDLCIEPCPVDCIDLVPLPAVLPPLAGPAVTALIAGDAGVRP